MLTKHGKPTEIAEIVYAGSLWLIGIVVLLRLAGIFSG